MPNKKKPRSGSYSRDDDDDFSDLPPLVEDEDDDFGPFRSSTSSSSSTSKTTPAKPAAAPKKAAPAPAAKPSAPKKPPKSEDDDDDLPPLMSDSDEEDDELPPLIDEEELDGITKPSPPLYGPAAQKPKATATKGTTTNNRSSSTTSNTTSSSSKKAKPGPYSDLPDLVSSSDEEDLPELLSSSDEEDEVPRGPLKSVTALSLKAGDPSQLYRSAGNTATPPPPKHVASKPTTSIPPAATTQPATASPSATSAATTTTTTPALVPPVFSPPKPVTPSTSATLTSTVSPSISTTTSTTSTTPSSNAPFSFSSTPSGFSFTSPSAVSTPVASSSSTIPEFNFNWPPGATSAPSTSTVSSSSSSLSSSSAALSTFPFNFSTPTSGAITSVPKVELDTDIVQKIKSQQAGIENFLKQGSHIVNSTQEIYNEVVDRLNLKVRSIQTWLDNENKLLEEKEQKIKTKETTLEEDKKKLFDVEKLSADKIVLNVGGKTFTTTKATLAKHESFLSMLLTSSTPEAAFIDRDPKIFRYILNFLRTGAVPTHLSEYERQLLKDEAEFFQIPSLIAELKPGYSLSVLHPVDAQMKNEEDAARTKFVTSPKEALENGPYWMCIPIYDNNVSSFVCDSKLSYPEVFEHVPKLKSDGELPIAATLDEFKENFRFASGDLLAYLNWSNVFVAGGSVLGSLLKPPIQEKKGTTQYIDKMTEWYTGMLTLSPDKKTPFADSDVDIFLYGLTPEEANKKVEEICDQIVKAIREIPCPYYKDAKAGVPSSAETGLKLLVARTEHAITFIVDERRPHIQIVLRLYSCPAEVLMGFDIDSCCVGYDGNQVWALPRARRSIVRGYNLIDPSRQSKSYESRLVKYSNRGFRVAVPGFNRGKVRFEIYNQKAKDLKGLSRLLKFEMVNILGQVSYWEVAVPSKNTIEEGHTYEEGLCMQLWSRKRESVERKMEYIIERNQHTSDYSSVYFPSNLNAENTFNLFRWRRYYSNATTVPCVMDIFKLTEWFGGGSKWTKGNIKLKNVLDTSLVPKYKVTIPRYIEWITENPGRQLTGSFNPVEGDWYAGAMKI